ncbi:hypothetical protein LCGC14_2374270, partial [marine sediment metagenome]
RVAGPPPPPPPTGGIQPSMPTLQEPAPFPQAPNINIQRPEWGGGAYAGGNFGEGSFYNQLRQPITADIGLSDLERKRLSNIGRANVQGSTKALMDEFSSAAGGRGFRAGESGRTDTALGQIAQRGVSALSGYESNLAINEANNRFGQNMALNQANLGRMSAGAGIDLGRESFATQRYGVDAGLAGQQAELQLQQYGIDVGANVAGRGLDLNKYGIDVGAGTSRYGIETGAQVAREGLGTQRYGIDVGAETSRYGIDVGAQTAGRALDLQRYGIDVGAETSRYGTDVGAETSRYGVDVMAGVDMERIRSQADIAKMNLHLSNEQFQQQFGFSKEQFQYYQEQDAIRLWLDYYSNQQGQQQDQWTPWWLGITGTGSG